MVNSSIHIKIDYPEAAAMKRDMLLIEKNLLESSKFIKNYNDLRKKEFILKSKVKKDFEILTKIIDSIQEELPQEETKEIIESKPQKIIMKKPLMVKEKRNTDIENQLEEIRRKLAMLE